MKSTKRLLIFEVVLLLVAILMFTQATYSYFTSKEQVSSTVTAGNVEILLSESAVKYDATGNLVEDTESTKIFGSASGTVHDYGIIFPGQSIFKNPTIQNIGTNDAYIAAKISITDGGGNIHRVLGDPDYDDIDITTIFGGGYIDAPAHFGTWNGMHDVMYNDEFAMIQIPDRPNGRYDVYIFILNPLPHAGSVVFFDQMHFPSEFTNEEMNEFRDLRVDIYGFGVQTFGFESCYDAMIGALPEHFADFSHSAP